MQDLVKSEIQLTENIIIGAGIAGLTLANRFESGKRDYIILEKSRGVGGRMATRRFDSSTFDHGAQFFKIRHDQKNFWQNFITSPLAHLWFEDNHTGYYSVKSGMTQAAKTLINKEKLKLNEKVLFIEKINSSKAIELNLIDKANYCIKTESGKIFSCQNIYLTCPLPQSLQILKDSAISYDADLEKIYYAKALVGLFELQTDSQLIKDFNYAENISDTIYSISNQKNKGTSQSLAFTLTAQSDLSEKYFEQPDVSNLELITEQFVQFLKSIDPQADFKITQSELKKWRYSHPVSVYPKPYSEAGIGHGIYLIGDAFIRSSLMGSIQSALAVPIG